MADEEENDNEGNDAEITVTAPSLEDIADAIEAEFVEEDPDEETDETGPLGGFEELEPAIERMVEVYEGLVKATELDERGIMRHKVQELAGLEDMDRDAFGHHLRSLEHHGLAKQDGNRWSAPLTVEDDE
jgi:DNA-binding transcriptional ArsR family regulator